MEEIVLPIILSLIALLWIGLLSFLKGVIYSLDKPALIQLKKTQRYFFDKETLILTISFIELFFIGLLFIFSYPLLSHIFKSSYLIALIISIVLIFILENPVILLSQKSVKRNSNWLEKINNLIAIAYPLQWLIYQLRQLFKKVLRISLEEELISEEDIKVILAESKQKGMLEEEQEKMIHSVFDFGETIVREVMVPRISMTVVSSDTSFEKIVETITNTGYSRIPVYEGTIDNIIGIIYAKDLLKFLVSKAPFNLKEVCRKPYFVPETKKIDELFRELLKQQTAMAIVLDEYGGTDGIVTIEDLIEEIVGEIVDEYDKPSTSIIYNEDGSVTVDARMNIEDLNKELALNIPWEECETIGGFVYSQLGKVPQKGETIQVKGITFCVEEIKDKVIKTIKIKLPNPPKEITDGDL